MWSEARLKTYGDLLQNFPFRYIDRTQYAKIKDLHPEMAAIQVKGKIMRVEEAGTGRGKRLVAHLVDETGVLELVWFKGQKWVKPKLLSGQEFVVFGKPTLFGTKLNMAHPEFELLKKMQQSVQAALEPVYSSTEKLSARGLNSKGIANLQKALVPQIKGRLPETLPASLVAKYRLMPREQAYFQVHFPGKPEYLKMARYRLKFDEFFFIQLQMLRQKVALNLKLKGIPFETVGEAFNTFYKEHLPFPLTGAQKRVVKEIRADVGSGRQMNRLLQGDVGSGKTLVALLSTLIAIDNGYQAAVMAPTEILANQHLETFSEMLPSHGY